MASGCSSGARRRVATARIAHAWCGWSRAATTGAPRGQKSSTSLVMARAAGERAKSKYQRAAKNAPQTPFRAPQAPRFACAGVPRGSPATLMGGRGWCGGCGGWNCRGPVQRKDIIVEFSPHAPRVRWHPKLTVNAAPTRDSATVGRCRWGNDIAPRSPNSELPMME